ncbi:SulP family inorganic anion transporter [Anaerocolumna xylanovorans]|uniref:Sulfate permease, SulP family n=1 Tax=Anaerocolumna xylanovorans DSM 12503 TaxID=1121345 RepID=A0A1M7Y1V6_9FIRM|nr:SulP family inorganic anion transporter [Anaerocolumna xylanovorans]SHO45835.1 sulfate permease, SulP family [Anaerocolumna xylanovorans DSM 12503]
MQLTFLTELKNEFQSYNLTKFSKDLMAGLTVTAVALPLALAFGVSSGADAASGLITAIIAGLIVSFFSGAFYQISGPTGAMAAILMSIIAKYHMQGVFIATLIAGILLVIAGILHLGKVTSFIPSPVITGFTSGIAIIIVLGQIDNFFGVHSKGATALSKLFSYTKLGFVPDIPTLCVGLFVVLLMMFFPKKWNNIIPASLLGIILATAASILFHLDVKTVGEIPQTLFPAERLRLSGITWEHIEGLFSPAVSIAMLCMIESLLCGASAGRMADKAMNSDQELIAQGIGNMLIPFFGGIPATAAIARTSVAIKSGARTRLTGIIHGIGLLIAMFLLSPVMSKIPLTALAGVLIVTAWRMNEWPAIRYMFSRKFNGPVIKYAITMVATVALDLTTAILIGVLLGLFMFVIKSADIQISIEEVDPIRIGKDDNTNVDNWCVVYIAGPMFFMTADTVKKKLSTLHDRDVVILSLRGVSMADITSVGVIMDYYKQAKESKTTVLFSSIQPSVMKVFRQAGLVEATGEEAFFYSVDKVLLELL